MLHLRSTRQQYPFIKLNCAALPDQLLESELFGYEQGAFTGAVRTKPGQFELANQGTIFLDEIAEMSVNLQAKLLHALQDKEYARLGGRDLVKVDARVIAATNVDVQERVQSGTLRADLYYRLNMFSIHVPELRERTSDIPALFKYFHQKYALKFKKETPAPSENLLRTAMRYEWPGNVRELENFVKRYVILGNDDDAIEELHDLSAALRHDPIELAVSLCERGLKAALRDVRDVVKTQLIFAALAKTNWNRKKSAKLLGISYTALVKHVQRMTRTDLHAFIDTAELPGNFHRRHPRSVKAGI